MGFLCANNDSSVTEGKKKNTKSEGNNQAILACKIAYYGNIVLVAISIMQSNKRSNVAK